MKRLIVGIFAFAGSMLSAGLASADYICDTYFTPGSTTFGSHGSVVFTAYSGPDCSGTFVRSGVMCSSNATSGSCSTFSSDRATSDAEIVSIAQGLRDAAMWNAYVLVITTTCIGGGSGCASTVVYR